MVRNLRLTVFTPVYNRKHTISRPFESLMKQNCKDFEWLVVDDGSTDGIKEVIDSFTQKADFAISYYYKENGGKHTAMNMAYGLAKGEYFLVLDSDDALTETSVELMLGLWDSIPDECRERYWCVTGLCVDSENGEIIGDSYPAEINESANPRLAAKKIKGDKTGCVRTDIISRYPFPEPPGTTFITESIVWNKIEKDYRQYYSNETLKIVYLNEPDSLTAVWYKNHVKEGYISNYYWKLATLNDVGIQNRNDFKMIFTVPYYGCMCGKNFNEIFKGINKRIYKAAVVLMIIPAKLAKITRGKKLIKNA